MDLSLDIYSPTTNFALGSAAAEFTPNWVPPFSTFLPRISAEQKQTLALRGRHTPLYWTLYIKELEGRGLVILQLGSRRGFI